jgi:hypothetical protein
MSEAEEIKEIAKQAFKENNKELFEEMNVNIDDGIKILDRILNSCEKEDYVKMSMDILGLKIKNVEKCMSAVMALLLKESAYNNTGSALESGFIDPKNIGAVGFKKKIFEIFVALHFMNYGKDEIDKLSIFLIAMNLLVTSDMCPTNILVKFMLDVCSNKKIPVSALLESFYNAFSFYINPEEFKEELESCAFKKETKKEEELEEDAEEETKILAH